MIEAPPRRLIRLGELLEAPLDPALAALTVSGLKNDSRKVEPGDLFVAIPGVKGDGAAYAEPAAKAGAAAIVAERAVPAAVPVIVVPNARLALSQIAARFYPRQPETIAAVTGTSGKTSVAAFLRQIFLRCGRQAASLGTIGVIAPGRADYGSLTTPDPISLHATLQELADGGVTHLAMEASSHGLDQFRLDGVRPKAAGFTNLTPEHLDYHATLEAYLEAKLRLFRVLLRADGVAVVDADHEAGARVAEAVRAAGRAVLTVGRAGEGITLLSAEPDGDGQRLALAHAGRRFETRLPLVGAFQVSNALVAAGLAIGCGEAPNQVFAALEGLEGAPGRLDKVGTRNGAPVFVDYAHKSDALRNVLETLRPYAKRHLVVVFGCGGDRDRGKRPVMGEIAAAIADRVIVTDDNPRSEDPAAIRAAILAGARGAEEIGDRAAAIRTAIRDLQAGDILLIAGKGHETGQIVGSTVLPFSDHQVAQTAIRELEA